MNRQKKKTIAKPRKDPSHLGLRNYQHPDNFGDRLGYEVEKIDRKRHVARVSLRVREDHLSPAGRVHGGVISAFFDFASGAAVFSTLGPHDFCSTVELKVNYFRPIELGHRLHAEVRVVFRGKRLCVVHGLCYRQGQAEPVAMATATFNIVRAG
jgi:acyl-CoA thioesterase